MRKLALQERKNGEEKNCLNCPFIEKSSSSKFLTQQQQQWLAMPVLLGNVGGHIGDYVAFECPGKSAVQEEDRTDRASDSRGSFRLSNLVQAGTMEQQSRDQHGAIKRTSSMQQQQLPPPLVMLP